MKKTRELTRIKTTERTEGTEGRRITTEKERIFSVSFVRSVVKFILLITVFVLGACSSAPKSAPLGPEYETGGGGFALANESFYEGNGIAVAGDGNILLMSGPFGKIEYDVNSGLASFYKIDGEAPFLTGVYAETELGGRKVRTTALNRDPGSVTAAEISDGFGQGVKVAVRNRGLEGLFIVQNYYLYGGRGYALVEAALESPAGLETNYIAPVAAGGSGAANTGAAGAANAAEVVPAIGADPRFLFVPFDNDAFVRYRSDKLLGAGDSYEVTAVFDNASRAGFVAGSVSHDTWKTGVRGKAGYGRNAGLAEFRVFGGITSGMTRDILPHGTLIGKEILSPKVLVGWFDDWRNGMEEYGAANGIIAPPLPWDNGPPFGWNSWSAVADKVNYDIYVLASDFLKENMPAWTNNQGMVYINFDSFWDNLSELERKNAAAHVIKNGQHPGFYHTPFVFWGDNIEWALNNGPAEAEGRYRYYDMMLKDKNGRPLPPIDGGIPLDPTHPGTIAVTKARFDQFREQGYDYVKLDFMSHGAVEGASYYEKSVRTGIQAYNYGMKKLLELLGDDIKNQKFFVSLSIAPIFPANYAHGRRISCDVFGDLSNAEYMLNSLSYGWWLNRAVYPYNDPDHIVVYNSYNHREPPYLYNEGLTRYLSTAIGGTFMIDSDDLRIPESRERVKQILNNPAVNKMAADGISFRPVEGNTGDRAADTFVRQDTDGTLYLAVFNFNKENPKTMNVSFERLGLDPDQSYRMLDMVSNKEEPAAGGSIAVTLEPAEPKIFKVWQ